VHKEGLNVKNWCGEVLQ